MNDSHDPTSPRVRETADALIEVPWHTSMHYEGTTGDKQLLVAYPVLDDDPDAPPMVRVETLDIDADDSEATNQLWDVRELARFCRLTLANLEADGSLARALAEEEEDDDDDEDDDEDDDDDDDEDDDDDDDDTDGEDADDPEQ